MTFKHGKIDVAIVGAGPIGIELAAALKKAGISYLIFDKGQAGQMIYNFPPQTIFFSSSERIGIAGLPLQTVNQQKCTREAYLTYLRMVIGQNKLKINAFEEITDIKPIRPNGFLLTSISSAGKKQYQVKNVVLATGGTSHPRLLGIPGENLPHVSIKMEDPHKYFQRKVLIIGSRNSAAEAALRCFHAGAHVSLAFRREELHPEHIKYWVLPDLKSHIAKNEIIAYPATEIVEIHPNHVVAQQKGKKKHISIPCDFVIKALGFEADMSLCLKLGIDLKPPYNAPAYNENTMETSIKGVFVLGTLTGGTQVRYRVFIENCHDHVDKIMNTLAPRLGKKWISTESSSPENKILEE